MLLRLLVCFLLYCSAGVAQSADSGRILFSAKSLEGKSIKIYPKGQAQNAVLDRFAIVALSDGKIKIAVTGRDVFIEDGTSTKYKEWMVLTKAGVAWSVIEHKWEMLAPRREGGKPEWLEIHPGPAFIGGALERLSLSTVPEEMSGVISSARTALVLHDK
jgi:hypothetical protein